METGFCFDCVYLLNFTVLCNQLIYLNIYGTNYFNTGTKTTMGHSSVYKVYVYLSTFSVSTILNL